MDDLPCFLFTRHPFQELGDRAEREGLGDERTPGGAEEVAR